uniref:Uncharacterized protein n=1 Tax=Utricularia reniformis TaxID=192314 RepID=A0A1Y0AZK5_9LAMI|nr:hypothetical protein AEK19_MT0298 [Utricularia reniformis]ART30574.1 hypothetical protein AEK19_MT0298 [Utricularia reniformis]
MSLEELAVLSSFHTCTQEYSRLVLQVNEISFPGI